MCDTLGNALCDDSNKESLSHTDSLIKVMLCDVCCLVFIVEIELTVLNLGLAQCSEKIIRLINAFFYFLNCILGAFDRKKKTSRSLTNPFRKGPRHEH